MRRSERVSPLAATPLRNFRPAFIVNAVTGTVLHRLRLKRRPRVALVLLCLLACTAQSFVAQTHVHAADNCGQPVLAASDCPEGGVARHNSGSNTGCPLCQVVLHGGAAPLAPHALSIPLLAKNASPAPEQLAIDSIAAVSYHWQSRGPPHS
jgi:hypothetical protein